uniref:Uncharacterized protein n=1 Tax=Knipowitschia caucasica TaxID=637954 RepID=A0AAV2L4S0_KNICA
MAIYAELLSQACSQQLEKEVPSIVVPPSPSKSYTWRYKPKVVVVGPEPSPCTPPPEWTVVGQGRKELAMDLYAHPAISQRSTAGSTGVGNLLPDREDTDARGWSGQQLEK